HNVTIVDTLPAGLSYVAGSASPITPTITNGGKTLTFAIGTLAPGQGGSITYSVTVTQTGQQTDSADISATEAEPAGTSGDNHASCTSGVAFVDVFVTKACPAT